MRELIAVYLRHCAAVEKHRHQTRRSVESLLAQFVEDFGERDVHELRAFQMSDWIESRPGWRKTGTRRKVAAILKAPFGWAFHQGRIDRHPFAGVRYAKGERAAAFPDDAIDKLIGHGADAALKTAHWRFVLAVEFLRLSGCRISELCAARWEEIDFDRGLWILADDKSRRTRGKAKKIPLIPEALDVLRPHRQESGPIFLNTRGTRAWTRGSFWNYFDRWRSKLTPDQRGSVHGIRHTFATVAIANGASPKLVGAGMGHASAKTTEESYCDLDDEVEAIREAARLTVAKRQKS